ncbi:MAG: HAD family hydrolase [Sphingomonadales bacterium]|nr:HAD family hydrolase [Sphingomonadales bacterium]
MSIIASRDEPRADSKPAIAALMALGIKSLMLSGDNQRTASAVAAPLGMGRKANSCLRTSLTGLLP